MKNTSSQWLKSFLHAAVLFLLCITWVSTPLTTDDEELIVKWSSRFHAIFRKEVDPEGYLFIDISHDKDTIPSSTGTGIDVITDRKKLSVFFSKINRIAPTYRYILCDLNFKGKSRYDDMLAMSLKGLNHIAIATHLDENGEIEKNEITLPEGITSANENENGFIKFKLVQDVHTPTLPVLMYQQLGGTKLKKWGPFCFDNSALCFNTIIGDQKIRNYTVFHEKIYHVSRLSDLIDEKETELNGQWLKNRIIVIGDFENDRHGTIFGQTAGALILLNIYLGLCDGLHIISFWWVVFMLLGFTCLTKITLYHRSSYSRKKLKWLGPFIKETLFLFALSALSYAFFGRQVQIFIGLAYIYSVHFFIVLSKEPFSWRHFKHSLIHIKKLIFSE